MEFKRITMNKAFWRRGLMCLLTFSLLMSSCASAQRRGRKQKEKQEEIAEVITPEVPQPKKPTADEIFFMQIAARYPATIQKVLEQKDDNSVQIIYTEINRDKNDRATLCSPVL